MKYLKLYENKSIESVRHMLTEYQEFKNDIRPFIINKFYYLAKLAKKNRYEPETGSTPNKYVKEEKLILTDIFQFKNHIEFTLETDDNDQNYYISITNDELKEFLIEIEAKKFNL